MILLFLTDGDLFNKGIEWLIACTAYTKKTLHWVQPWVFFWWFLLWISCLWKVWKDEVFPSFFFEISKIFTSYGTCPLKINYINIYFFMLCSCSTWNFFEKLPIPNIVKSHYFIPLNVHNELWTQESLRWWKGIN